MKIHYLSLCLLITVMAALVACARMSFSEDRPARWWELETSMTADGIIVNLAEKSWWPRALELDEGEQMLVQSQYDGGGLMLVRRERQQARFRDGEIDTIVWTIDDDGDMDPNNPRADDDSDCIFYDYGRDGLIDYSVDLIDYNGDGQRDERNRRSYYQVGDFTHPDERGRRTGNYGRLTFSWNDISFGEANRMSFLNKFNPNTGFFFPFSECPFAYWDTDGDNYPEVVARFSAVPINFNILTHDPDYANVYPIISGPFEPEMENMGVVNVRYSFDIDNLSGEDYPNHYEMGFNMIGRLPYDFSEMRRSNSLRRAPKTLAIIPYDQIRSVCESYPADNTGFTFHEFEAANIAIGVPERNAESDRRWEGVFWSWHRHVMHNTGGPIQVWNLRREYRGDPAQRREIYFSPVDRRLHMKGATDGWIRVGMIVNQKPIGEVRMFDTDRDGYFDRWEHYVAGQRDPYRVDTSRRAENVDFGDDWEAISEFYTQTVLPEAIALNKRFIAAVRALGDKFASPAPANLTEALARDLSPSERRYILDQVREYYYRLLREGLLARTRATLDSVGLERPHWIDKTPTRRIAQENWDTESAWALEHQLTLLDAAMGEGRLAEATHLIGRMKIKGDAP